MDMDFFKNGEKHVIWKRSQHLYKWKQRQLQFIENSKIATAKEQSVDGWNASFHINMKEVTKLAIYPPDFIHNHFMVMIKVNYGSKHTYMADEDQVAFELFMAMIRNKCITSLQKDKLEKHEIAGNTLIHYGTETIIDRFVIYRKAGIITKDWVKEEMIITDKRLITYSKMGFGQQANEKGDWHLEITEIKRIKTEFKFWKDCLIIKINTSILSSDQFAVPIEGEQIKSLCRAVAEHKRE